MNLVKSVLVVSVIFSALFAEARSVKMKGAYQADLEKPTFTKNARLSSFQRISNRFAGASVYLSVNLRDVEDNYLVVTVYQKSRCIENRCFGLPAPVSLKVPYQKMELNSCGARVYSGVQDDRESGGRLTEITLVDNGTNHCRYLIAIPATEVTVKEKTDKLAPSGRSYEAITEFAGDKLITLE